MTPYSELRIVRSDLASMIPLAQPLSVYLELDNACNFKCNVCPLSMPDWSKTVGGHAKWTMDMVREFFHDLACFDKPLKAIKFYSEGEPLLDIDLLTTAIKLSQGFTERTEVTSNGSALTLETAQRLIRSGLDYLRISIYAMTDDRHFEITGSRVSPSRILDNVKRFRDIRGDGKPWLYVKMIGRHEEDLFRAAYTAIADEVAIEEPMDWDSQRPGTLGPIAVPRKRVCPLPFYSAVIKADGSVVACCVDWSKKTTVGNIRERPFSVIWSGKEFQEFRAMQLAGKRCSNEACRNCWYPDTVPDDLDSLLAAEVPGNGKRCKDGF